MDQPLGLSRCSACVLGCLVLASLICGCNALAHPRAHDRDGSVSDALPRDAGSSNPSDVGRDAGAVSRSAFAAPIHALHDASAALPPTAAGDAGTALEANGPFRLVRTHNWPGGGIQLTLLPLAGQPCEQEAVEPRLLREDGSELVHERAALDEEDGITALIIAPSADAAEHAAQLQAASALIEMLPVSERIGIWLGSGQLPLVCELSERREHVLSRLSAIPPQAAAPIERSALLDLQRRLRKVSGPYATPVRTLIAVGDAQLTAAEGWLRLSRRAPSSSAVFGWDESVSAVAAGRELGVALLRARQRGFRLGACGVAEGQRLTLELGQQRIAVQVPAEASAVALGCDAAAAAQDAYPFPVDVWLPLDQTQLAEHDRLAAAKDESDFAAQIAFGQAEPIAARAHFRGQTTLDCARKSYSIHFSDNEARRLMSHAHTNEFLLLSLCADKGWFRQALANRVMHRLGLFPLEHQLVKLRVADRELGVYLMLEKPDEALRDRQSKLAGLVRRRYDPAEEPAESDYPKPKKDPEGAARALSEYNSMVALVDTVEPGMLAQALSARLDLDSYLHWLAVMNIFQSGDYADEVFFYASDESAAVGGGWYFRPLGWDSDDLFSACHLGGKYAISDPAGVLYCLEGKLDRALFVAPDIYTHFADEFTRLMAGPLSTSEILADLMQVRAQLTALLVDDPVCVGTGLLIDSQPATCDKLQPWLASTIDELAHQVDVRSRGLAERIRKRQALP